MFLSHEHNTAPFGSCEIFPKRVTKRQAPKGARTPNPGTKRVRVVAPTQLTSARVDELATAESWLVTPEVVVMVVDAIF